MLGPIKFREAELVFETWVGAAAPMEAHTCSKIASMATLKRSIVWHVGQSRQL